MELPAKAPAGAWHTVLLLGAFYIVAFADRLILGLLIAPIRHQFNISDTQISLLIGFNFAVFYALLGIPMGRLADRTNRRNLILISTLIWATCTFLSGTASSFWMLCALRIGVAIGEAALSPSAISMIGDLFPPAERGRATSLYMSLGALGATGAFILGGLVVGAIGQFDVITIPVLGNFQPWQTVFLAAASPALILALLLLVTVREPKRALIAPAAAEIGAKKTALPWATKPWRPLLLLFLGGSVGQMIVRGASLWAPTYLVRNFDWVISTAGIQVGLVTMICGVGGMMIWPFITELWLRRGRADALPVVLTFGMLFGAVMLVIAALAPNATSFLTAYGLSMFTLMGTGVLLMVSIQLYVLPNMRGEFMALCLLMTALIADGLGPTLVPFTAELIGGANGALSIGYVALSLFAGPIAAAIVWLARPGLSRLREAQEA